MANLSRQIEAVVSKYLIKNKVVMILGARRVGKTELLYKIANHVREKYILLNGDDITTIQAFETRSVESLKKIVGDIKLLIIDEAQEIPDIGKKLKLMVDSIPDIKIIVSGSSAFELNNELGEPLVGRKYTLHLYPLSQQEFSKKETRLETIARLDERLIYGGYPELLHIPNLKDKAAYLREQVNSYLLKDVLSFEGIKKRDKILMLLTKIAYRAGSEISIEGLANEIQVSKNTVEKYLDLFAKVFILYKVVGFSRNMHNEITKKNKWFFVDNGIRNAVINNFHPLNMRDDLGLLWENYINAERKKKIEYEQERIDEYFWRTHTRQEIDRIEEKDGRLFAYEYKFSRPKKESPPPLFAKNYPEASFQIIHKDNYLEYILQNSSKPVNLQS